MDKILFKGFDPDMGRKDQQIRGPSITAEIFQAAARNDLYYLHKILKDLEESVKKKDKKIQIARGTFKEPSKKKTGKENKQENGDEEVRDDLTIDSDLVEAASALGPRSLDRTL